jgi:Flp pilus assembly protein TadG
LTVTVRIRVQGDRPDDSGAAAVEFALVVPVLLLIVFGVVQYSFYFWALQGGSDAARDAARRAAVGSPVTCAAFVTSVSTNIAALKTGNVSVKRDYSATGSVAPGDTVTVTVAFDSLDFNFPFVPFVDSGRVFQQATARVENVPDLTLGDCA